MPSRLGLKNVSEVRFCAVQVLDAHKAAVKKINLNITRT